MKKPRGPKPSPDKDEWQRTTFFVRKEYVKKIKQLAYWDRKTIKEIIDQALGSFLKGKSIRTIKRKGK